MGAEDNVLTRHFQVFLGYHEAEKYFTFIVKYDFAGRDNFLRGHIAYLDDFANSNYIYFYEKLLSVYPDRSTEFHLKSRIAFADKLLSKGCFSEAEAMCKKVLELESENGAALQGLLYCTLELRGDEGGDPQWQNWDQKLFERVLAACPNKKAQSDLVNKMCKLCIESMKKQGRNVGGPDKGAPQKKISSGNENAGRDAGHNGVVMIDGAYYKRNSSGKGTGGYDYDDNYYKNREGFDEERRKEETRRAEQEKERQRRLAVLKKRISIYTWACWGSFILATLFFVAGLATLFFVAGVVLWSVFGERMPYVFAGLGWLFVVALILYIAVFVFAGKRRRMEKQQEDIGRQVERQIAKSAKSETKGSSVVFITCVVAFIVVCIVGGILLAIFQ